ncbi:MAG: TolC family protein, partial [Tannerellaceae bacterium]|nr:TolC family protein [Tannerellaceae bacterium]
MKRICSFLILALILPLHGEAQEDTLIVELSLQEAIHLAQSQSVDAAVALNELKTAYWEYRTHRADQLPEVNFTGSLPNYYQRYNKYQKEDGSYTFVKNNSLELNGQLSITQNIALTGGQISLNSDLSLTRQLGSGAFNEYMSVPIGLTFTQPIFGANHQKWKRRIEPVRYKEAEAAYMESTEEVTIKTINYFFQLLQAQVSLSNAQQNLENANKLYDIAIAKRKIGHISEMELMRLKQSALQAESSLTSAQSNLNANMFQLRAFLGLSEQEVIQPALPEFTPDIELEYKEVLGMALENNAFAKNILRRQIEADYNVATAKGNQRSME